MIVIVTYRYAVVRKYDIYGCSVIGRFRFGLRRRWRGWRGWIWFVWVRWLRRRLNSSIYLPRPRFRMRKVRYIDVSYRFPFGTNLLFRHSWWKWWRGFLWGARGMRRCVGCGGYLLPAGVWNQPLNLLLSRGRDRILQRFLLWGRRRVRWVVLRLWYLDSLMRGRRVVLL